MKNIQINSKLIQLGDIFVGISCPDLEKNIEEAFANGASIVFAEKSQNDDVIVVDDARLTASRLAKFLYNKQPKFCVSLTGTNGKSSVAHFLKQIWQYSGKKSANLGTLGLFINDSKVEPVGIDVPNLTTPDSITLHRIMEYLADNDVTHFVFEASSHALDQKRLHSAELSAAAFTNLASDHMDYHKTKEDYLWAKLKLFEKILDKQKPAVASYDYEEICEAVSKYNDNLITFGLSSKNFIKAQRILEFPEKIVFDLICGEKKFENITINLFGEFQIMNILCAVALAYAVGDIKIEDIVETLGKIKPLEGRMEHIANTNGGDIYVDYAHTTEGFKKALECFKKACKGRLICVFGCGGDRDKSKRQEMGEIAQNLADVVIITDDNPRTEDPASIRAAIIEKCKKAIEIGDRKEAIYKAIELIQPDDFVAIIGKGHEDYQIYRDQTIHFSDKETVLDCI